MTNVSRRMFLAGSGAAALGTIGTLGVGAAGAAEVCRMPKKWDHTYDVIVIGAGGAGMAAGISAAEAGARTVVLEKLGFPGGNTMASGGGMNGYVKADAEAAGVEDSAKLHAEQTLAAGDFRADPALVRQYAEKMPETVEWFKSLGIEFTPIYQIYGGLWPRCRNPQGEQGAAYTAAEVKRLKSRPRAATPTTRRCARTSIRASRNSRPRTSRARRAKCWSRCRTSARSRPGWTTSSASRDRPRATSRPGT